MNPLTIGKLARASGVGVETVRFYERRGLIKQPAARKGYRTYSEDDARRIRFIKRAQELGFTLKEIKGLFDLHPDARLVSCAAVKRHADGKIKEVEGKLRDLQKMKRALTALSAACGDGRNAVAQCRISDCFEPDGTCP
jgi:MerR family transcriptional regulator, mercuric resistance operon regulatory protein